MTRGSWSFNNDFARNVVIFGVDNGSSSHSDNRKNNFLILHEGQTYGINGSSGSPEKMFSIMLTFHLCLVNFPTFQFCLESISDGFSATGSGEVSLNGNVYGFSVDYNSIDRFDILKIHKYLMRKNNIK